MIACRYIGAVVLLTALPAFAADLNFTVGPVRSAAGEIRLALFEREQGFRKEDQARQRLALAAKTGSVQGVFRDLPAGRYAVMAYHDENGDGELNLRFGMFPKEGYGLSNNPKISGPPRFKDAVIDLPEAGAHLDIQLKY